MWVEELAAVQMSPDPLLRMVEDRRPCSAFQAGKQNPRRMRNRHVHPLLLHVHRHRVNGPRGHNPQKILVQLRVSHRSSLLHRGYR